MSRAVSRAAFAALLVAASPVLSASAAPASRYLSAEPVVLMDGDAVAACGVRMLVTLEGTTLAVDLKLERDATTGQSQAVVRAGYEPPQRNLLPVTRLELKTASLATSDIFQKPGRYDDWGTLFLETEATDARLSPLFQELMVGGASIHIAREFLLEPDTITIPGPLPQSVRSAYLACTGDLAPPAE